MELFWEGERLSLSSTHLPASRLKHTLHETKHLPKNTTQAQETQLMEPQLIYEIIGYAASALVAVSLMMSKIIRLRIINLIGSATFSVYGILIGSIPVAGMNAFIVLVNVYYLAQIFASSEYFKMLKVEYESEYLTEFLNFYAEHIHESHPEFNGATTNSDLNLLVLRDMVPAGVLIAKFENNGILNVQLDFVVPKYRDFKIGKFLFKKNAAFFRERGVREAVTKPANARHNRYLRKMGFRLDRQATGLYRLEI